MNKIISFLLLIGFGCSCSRETGTEGHKLASVFVRKVQSEIISDTLAYPARVSAKVNAILLSESNGIVSQILVALGQRVKAQQTLMILSHTDPVYQYAPVQVFSPIDGVVSSVDVTRGSHVIEGQTLAAVINPAHLEIQTEIPAQDLSQVIHGVLGEFRVPGEAQAFKIEVSGVSPFVKPGTGTAVAKLKILSSIPPSLTPGMQGKVSFKVNVHSGFLVPDTAIVYKGKETYVRVVEDLKVKQIAVELGPKQRGALEIIQGLTVGLELVERASRSVADGEMVTLESVVSPSGKPQ